MLIYHAIWTLVVLALTPILPLRKSARLRSRVVPRLRLRPPRPGCVWVHALSVGEVISAVPLVRELVRRCPERDVVVTVTTVQGMDVARKELGPLAYLLLPMPLDFWGAYRRLCRFLRPGIFVLVETDLWPGLMQYMRRRGVPTVVVNGRVSPRTHRGYRRMGPLARFVLKGPVLWLMQSEHDRTRLMDSGVDPERIRVIGNIKFDRERHSMGNRERRAVASALGISVYDGPVWVAGSTHPGEEDILLEVFARLRRRFSSLRLVLAPRRVERAQEVRAKGEALRLSVALRSGSEEEKTGSSVVVLDTLGELERVYGLAFVSFVGGSLVPVGGHNLLEPAGFGRPVLFGPHMHNFKELSESLLAAGGGVCVRDGRELERIASRLLDDPEKADRMGDRARAFVESNRGAVERAWTQLNRVVPLGSPTVP